MLIPEWLKHPKWKWMRPPLGFALVLLGCFGFLPVLGFWMIPLGLAVLAVDFLWAEKALHWLKEKWRALEARWRAWRAKG
ncbi:MAG: PGPGW domain-containing protein [Rhodoblastus sp.]